MPRKADLKWVFPGPPTPTTSRKPAALQAVARPRSQQAHSGRRGACRHHPFHLMFSALGSLSKCCNLLSIAMRNNQMSSTASTNSIKWVPMSWNTTQPTRVLCTGSDMCHGTLGVHNTVVLRFGTFPTKPNKIPAHAFQEPHGRNSLNVVWVNKRKPSKLRIFETWNETCSALVLLPCC